MSQRIPTQSPPPYTQGLASTAAPRQLAASATAAVPPPAEGHAHSLPAYATLQEARSSAPSSNSSRLPSLPEKSNSGVFGIYNTLASLPGRFKGSATSKKELAKVQQKLEFDAGEKARQAAGRETLTKSARNGRDDTRTDLQTPWGLKRFHYPSGELIRIPFEPKLDLTKKEASKLAKLRMDWEKEFGNEPFPGNAAAVLNDEKRNGY